MLEPTPAQQNPLIKDLVAGRAKFLENFSADEQFASYLNVPRFALRAVSHGLIYGYRRPGDDAIIETLASHHLKLGRQVRCLEIGAGVTAQWAEISGHRGAPWLSRYLALHHADKFEIVASDLGRSDKEDHLSMSKIHWRDGAQSWDVRAETFALWKKDVSAALYNKLRETFSSDSGCGCALPAANFGLQREDFTPTKGASYPRFKEDNFNENLIVLPEIVPRLERSMFNLRFDEGVDISSPPSSLGQFDVIFGRHLGIGKHTLLNSIPKLAGLLTPGGKIFLYTDYSPFTVLITYEDGILKHSFPDGDS